MTGHIRRRGARSWELKFDLGTDPATGKRKIRFASFKGTKRDAEIELARLITVARRSDYVDPSRMTLGEFLDHWLRDWAASNISGSTFEQYERHLATYVRTRLGALTLQKVKPANLAALYAELSQRGRKRQTENAQGEGLSPRTVAYVHRILHRAFGHACKWGLLSINPVLSVEPPRAAHPEIIILTEEQVRSALQKLRGRPIYPIVALGLATGMRRGELLALRWKNVDLDAAQIRIECSLEETKGGLRFKSPKTKHGRRAISISPSIVAELRAHRRKQVEVRLSLGLGKEPDDALVFRSHEGLPLVPNSVSTEWRRMVRNLDLPKVTLHAWRHTHASQLIASGMDVLTISRRLGHASPSITLDVYGHLFNSGDERAAAVFERAFGKTLTE